MLMINNINSPDVVKRIAIGLRQGLRCDGHSKFPNCLNDPKTTTGAPPTTRSEHKREQASKQQEEADESTGLAA